MGLERNLFTLLDRAARSPWADRPAFYFEGEARTYAELRERSLRLANGLTSIGVAPGDRVAVLLGNRHEWPETLFGVAAMGGVSVPVNVLLRAEEVVHLVEDSGSTTLIVDSLGERLLGGVTNLPARVVRVGDVTVPESATAHDYEALIAGSADSIPPGPGLNDLCILYYSSGTTGLPKAAAHTHDGVLWNSIHQVPDLRLTGEDHYLVLPSLSWAAGFNDLVLALIYVGACSTLLPTGGMAPDRLATAFETSGATHALLVPTLLKQLLANPDALERIRNTKLRWIVSGAEPVPRSVIDELQAALPGCEIVQGYGMSEFPTIATILQPEDAVSHAGSAGQPCSITQMAIQLHDGTIADSGEGEILLRTPATMVGYYNRPNETAAAFADGWFHTGDLGRLDEHGYVEITGRKKDMIISGGLNVYPKEVEEVIYRLDGITEAAVVGVPDDKWGEVAVAVVVPGPGGFSDSALLDACHEKLASYKCPRAVLVHPEPLPRTLSGKVLKRELRPWAAEQLRAPVTTNPPEVSSA
jgi:acyl-CoA synthetase (AMP-forming)/AMP-acid ligase II